MEFLRCISCKINKLTIKRSVYTVVQKYVDFFCHLKKLRLVYV
jgi:hypothetical protein